MDQPWRANFWAGCGCDPGCGDEKVADAAPVTRLLLFLPKVMDPAVKGAQVLQFPKPQ